MVGAIVAAFAQIALQVSGFKSLPLAIGLWVLCGGLLLWSALPLIKKVRVRSPIVLQAPVTYDASLKNQNDATKIKPEEKLGARQLIQTLIGHGTDLQARWSSWRELEEYKQLSRETDQWQLSVENKIWSQFPSLGNHLSAAPRDITPEEKIQFHGVQMDEAMKRIRINRILQRLRMMLQEILP